MKQTLKFLCGALLLFIMLPLAAQPQKQVTVKGLVVGADGKPLPGVTVMVVGTSNGTSTDAEGKYTIRATADDNLLFTCIGFNDVQERVETRKQINVVMQEATTQLNETVVIAYGTARKSDLTGAVGTVNMDDLKGSAALTLDQALQGRVAGMEIISGGGEPGEGSSILIRGSRSISAGNEPLIVVDGVVDAVESFSEINVQDIKNVSVLKDASSTALYGSRGANGVILVTTKGGSSTKLTLNFQATVGISQLPRRLDLMDGTEFAQFRNDLRYISNYLGSKSMINVPLVRGLSGGYAIENPAAFGKGTDWLDVLTRTGVKQSYYASANWGENRTHMFLSISHDNEQGIVLGSDMKRIATLFKFDRQLFKWLTIYFRGNIAHINRNLNKVSISGRNTTAATSLSPLLKPKDTWNIYGDNGTNGGSVFNSPYYLATRVENLSKQSYQSVGGTLDFKLNRYTRLKTTFTKVGSDTEGYYYSPATLAVATQRKTGGTARRTSSLRDNYLSETTMTFRRNWKKTHHFDALAGFTMQEVDVNYKYTQGIGYLDDKAKYWNMGGIVDKRNLTETTTWSETKRMSVLGRVNYSYRSRYYFTVNGRYDGASMFAEGKKWGFFPSAAFKWNASNERFLSSAKATWLSDLSVRLSAGRSGNDALGSYVSQDALTTNQSGWLLGEIQQVAYYPTRLENHDLTWEKTTNFNLGIDLSILRDRFTFQLDMYKSFTDDLLLSVKNALHSGFGSRYANIGNTENQGVEFSFTSHNLSTRNFQWTTKFTISHNEQIVTDIGADYEFVPTYSASSQMAYGHVKGYPANSLWGYQFAGVWHNQAELDENVYTRQYASYTSQLGYSKYVDRNHDGVLDRRDYVYLGSPEPVLSGGLQNTFKWRGVEMGVYLTYSCGGKIYNMAETYLGTSLATTNHYRYMLDSWHPYRNPNSNIPSAYSTDGYVSDRFVHDASYLRLANVSLSYTWDLRRKTKLLRSVTFSASGDNLLLFSTYNGFDPDVTSSKTIRRLDNAAYPNPRKFQFSVKVTY